MSEQLQCAADASCRTAGLNYTGCQVGCCNMARRSKTHLIKDSFHDSILAQSVNGWAQPLNLVLHHIMRLLNESV